MSTSSVNNGSQANSDIGAIVPRVHFAEEAVAVREASPSNPDSRRCRRRRDQRATYRFQRATSIEVEFSNKFAVSKPPFFLLHVY